MGTEGRRGTPCKPYASSTKMYDCHSVNFNIISYVYIIYSPTYIFVQYMIYYLLCQDFLGKQKYTAANPVTTKTSDRKLRLGGKERKKKHDHRTEFILYTNAQIHVHNYTIIKMKNHFNLT